MEKITYINRKNTDCEKWDGLSDMYEREDLLAMWVADMDFAAPLCVQEALQNYLNTGVYGYYHVPDSYYEAFINWEKRYHNYDVQKDWIRFSPGVVSAFHWIVQFMTAPSDSVIVLTPVYYPFFKAVENNHRRLITSDLINSAGRYTIDFADFEKKIIENDVKLFILCSPHNPVGRVWTAEELRTLFEICKKHDVYVIADEIHHDLTFGGCEHIPALSMREYQDRIFMLTAASKTFNLAGCENSIIVIPDDSLRQKWDAFTSSIAITSGNPFGYVAVRAAYEKGHEWFFEVKKCIYENYQYVCETFAKELPEVIVSPLEGTYLCWIDMNAYVKPENVKDFMENKCKLAFDYGDWFGGERFASFIRMNLATSKENVEKCVKAIVENVHFY